MERILKISAEAQAAIDERRERDHERELALLQFKEHGATTLRETWVSVSVRARDSTKRVVQESLVNVVEAVRTGIWMNPETGEDFDINGICTEAAQKFQQGVKEAKDFNRIKLGQIAEELGLAKVNPGPLIQPKKNVEDYFIESVVDDAGNIYTCSRRQYQRPEAKGKFLASDIKANWLPGACFSGVFSRQRKAGDWLRSSGLYALDFDNVPQDELLKAINVIAADSCVAFLFVSPTGTGLKPIVYGPKTNTPQQYSDVYARIVEYAKTVWQLDAKLDADTSDCARLCFLSCDPEVNVNWDAVPLAFAAAEPIRDEAPPATERAGAPERAPIKTAQVVSGVDDLLVRKKELAEELLGDIGWDSEGADDGVCKCPGKSSHGSADNDSNDCHIHLNHFSEDNRPATIYCHHTSCKAEVDDANRKLRSAIGKMVFSERRGAVTVDNDQEKLQAEIKARVMAKPAHSLVYWSEQKIDPAKTLLGERFLCIGGGMVLVAPAGVGKSTAVTQAAALWSANLNAFDIKPARALRVMIVQAEDDEGDVIEMSQVVEKLGLTDEQKTLVAQNTLIIHVNDFHGSGFISALDYRLADWPADLVIINPLNGYSGCDPSDTAGIMSFLRQGLNPLMTKRQCAILAVHHSPKTRNWDTSKWKPHEFVYAASGNNEISNWCRSMVYVDPTYAPDTFKFIAAKRAKRTGWHEGGSWVYSKYFSHSPDGLLWLPSTPEQVEEAEAAADNAKTRRPGRKKDYDDDDLLAPLCRAEGVSGPSQLSALLERQMGAKAPSHATVDRRWNSWIERGVIEKKESGKWGRSISHNSL